MPSETAKVSTAKLWRGGQQQRSNEGSRSIKDIIIFSYSKPCYAQGQRLGRKKSFIFEGNWQRESRLKLYLRRSREEEKLYI